MAKLTVRDLNVQGKRVFVRVDYNVPLEEKDGQMVITDATRIVETLPTLRLLIGQGANLAGIDANTVAGITKAASGGAGQYATYNTLQNLINAQGAGSLTEFTPTNYGTLGGGP